MSSKRGPGIQLTKDGETFNGGGRDEPEDPPKRATAAQIAARK